MTGSDVFMRAAAALGERLVATAVHHEDRCTWLSHDIDESGLDPVVVEMSCGPDLYQGTSGIGLALARLAAATEDPDARRTALAALRHAVRHAPSDASLYGGRAGIALASVLGGSALADEGLADAGKRLAEAVARDMLAEEAGIVASWDLLGGHAGIVLALAALADDHSDVLLVDGARAAARTLVGRAVRCSHGWSWSSPGADEPPLCGLGHGASGAALALHAMARIEEDDRFDDAAAEAVRYERTWLDRTAGWPDLRRITRSSTHSGEGPTYPTHWCHGAAGIGIARIRLAAGAPESDSRRAVLLSEAAAAVDLSTAAALRSLPPARNSDSWRPNVSICHGLGSVAELHLEAFLFTLDGEHLRHARQLVLRGLGVEQEALPAWESGSVSDDEVRAMVATVPCGLPGAPEVPGLMLGTAGTVALLLRLSDPSSAAPVSLPSQAG